MFFMTRQEDRVQADRGEPVHPHLVAGPEGLHAPGGRHHVHQHPRQEERRGQ